eukprot:m.240449 g.240449  ORF g.240449 m.240449 type:complete len:135 (+) comp15153_c0_seq1:40-444(+)
MTTLSNESASDLIFEDEIEEETTIPLLSSEVERILNGRRELEKTDIDDSVEMPVNFTKALTYTNRFGNSRTEQQDEGLRRVVEGKGLHKYQEVQLISLAPEDVEEARSLIPRMDITDSELEDIINQIKAHTLMK